MAWDASVTVPKLTHHCQAFKFYGVQVAYQDIERCWSTYGCQPTLNVEFVASKVRGRFLLQVQGSQTISTVGPPGTEY